MHNAGFEDIPFKFHYSGNYNVIINDAPKVSIFIYSYYVTEANCSRGRNGCRNALLP